MMRGGILIEQIAAPLPEKRRRYGWCKDSSNNPLVKRVILYDNRTGVYIASTISRASDGYWEIRGLPVTQPDYSVMEVAVDDTRTYESVVRDHKSLVV